MSATPSPRPGNADPEATAAELMRTVGDVAAELHPGQAMGPVTLDSALDRDLGFDSLGRVELLARLERAFDVTLADDVFAQAETPRDLLRAVLRASGGAGTARSLDVAAIAVAGTEGEPTTAETLVEVLDRHVRAHPDRPHVRFYEDEGDGETLSFADLHRGAQGIAAGLRARDLGPGGSVVLMLPTSREYFLTFFGVLLAGGVPVPIYPPGRPAQIEEHLRRHAAILANCRARVMVTVAEAKPFARHLTALVETLDHVVTPDELAVTGEAVALPRPAAGDLAFLQYTSGSTGDPKGVMLTHANLLANIRALGTVLEASSDDVFVSWLPLYHDMGLIGAWLGSLYYAIPLVIMSPLKFLARPRRWLHALHRYRGTLSAAPNFAYELCLRRVDDKDLTGLDLSAWRMAGNGAEPVSPETVERFCARFAAYGFRRQAMMPMYGLAENSVGLALPPPDRGPILDHIDRERFMTGGRAVPAPESDPRPLTFVACGRPLPGHQIRIVDGASREVPDRTEGRLQFLGPSATSGYYRNVEATRRLFDGTWLDSGDRAYIADGDVIVTGRTKDIIIRAGRNIYPAELEEAVGAVADVRGGAVAVFASPDPDTGTERLVVLAETRRTDADAQAALRAEINAVATDLVGAPPDIVALAPPNTVPKTSSGKIRRASSREIYERGDIGRPRRAVWWQVARLRLAGIGPAARRALNATGGFLYATYAWTIAVGTIVTLWTGSAVVPGLSRRWAVAHAGTRVFTRLARMPLTVRGAENRPPAGRGCVIVSNHASYLDAFMLIAALDRPVAFVAKAELAASWMSRIPLEGVGCEFVERFDKEKGVEDARRLVDAVRAGRTVLFFAEGTLQRMPGLLPFHMGAFVAAVEADAPVVPIAIRGTRAILRDQSWFPRRGPVTVTIGEPMDPPADGDLWSRAVTLRDAARAFILRHCGDPDLGHEKLPF